MSDQIGHTRRVVHDVGWKAAAGERLGAAVAKSPGGLRRADEIAELRERLDEASSTAEQLRQRLDAASNTFDGLAADVEQDRGVSGHRLSVEVPALVDAVRQENLSVMHARDEHLRFLQQQVTDLDRVAAAARATASDLNRMVTDWLWTANAPLPDRPLISVVMTTAFPERMGYLRSAVDSVLAQTYSEWELIVIDDASQPFLDPPPDWWPDDARIRVVRGAGLSEGRSRNVGIAAVTGEIIAYLDDDCRWFPWWLHAVARTFSTEPDVGLVYGVRVIEADPGSSPWTYAQVLDPLSLHVTNPADTNVMAHRTGLANADWPDLSSCADYDTVIRLSEHGTQFLAVPAATYAVTSPSRAWAPERAEINMVNFRTVQRRARRARPLRVVAHNGIYPLLSETYIGDELEALRRHEVDIVMSRNERSSVPSPSRLDVPIHDSVQAAIEAHDPDLVLMHWADVGLGGRQACADAGVPYGIRMHSFDAGHRPVDLINDWCAGIWSFPQHAGGHHLSFALDTLIADPGKIGASPRNGRLLSLSAGLPKKDFANLMAAMELMASADIHLDVVIATTNGHEVVPTEVRSLLQRSEVRGEVTENLPFDQGQVMVRESGAIVYSLAAGQHIGQPRSVLEGAIAGTPLVVPDAPEMVALIGTTAHTYERGDAASLARAIDAALSNPHSWDDRVALSERVRHRHSGDKAFEDWANSVTSAVVTWQRNHRTDREGVNLRWWWPN